jgi:hypothetical protein
MFHWETSNLKSDSHRFGKSIHINKCKIINTYFIFSVYHTYYHNVVLVVLVLFYHTFVVSMHFDNCLSKITWFAPTISHVSLICWNFPEESEPSYRSDRPQQLPSIKKESITVLVHSVASTGGRSNHGEEYASWM